MWRGVRSVFRLVVRRPAVRDEVDDELRFHLETQVDDLVAQGWSRPDAEREARRRFGDFGDTRASLIAMDARQWRRTRRAAWAGDLARDLRYAVRGLRRTPGFTAGVALILGLGIGASVAIFRLIDATLLHPVPGVEAPAELHEITNPTLPHPKFQRIAANAAGMSFAAYRVRPLAVTAGDETAPEDVALVSGSYFPTLGASMAMGRSLGPGDDTDRSANVAVVSHAFWRRALGGRTDVLGQQVRVSGAPLVIVGVAPPAFRGLRVFESPEIWVPIHVWPAIRPSSFAGLDITRAGWGWLTVFGRLEPGASIAPVAAAAERISAQADEELGVPERFREPIALQPVLAAAIGGDAADLARVLGLVMGAVALLLLLASANVATLLLARAHSRHRELMVRSALGGGQARLVRMLLAEAALLSGLSAIVGFAVYHVVAGRIGAAVLPGDIRLDSVGLGLNGASLLALGGIAAFTAFLVGLAPSLRATSLATAGAPFGTGTRATSHRSRLRGGLIGVQVAIAVVLLLGASLFGRGLRTALAIDVGFDAAPLSVVSVNLGLARYDADRAMVFLRDAEDRVATQPGLQSVAWTTTPPLVSERSIETFQIEGQEPDPTGQPTAATNVVTPGFWNAYGVQATTGRLLEAADAPDGEPVIVVSDAFVTRYLDGAPPLGARVSIAGTPRRIVGVVRSMKYGDLSDEPDPMVYLPAAQDGGTAALGELFLVVRGAGPAAAAAAATLKEIDPAVPVRDLGAYPPLVAQRLLAQRLAFGLLLAFGALALVVAAIGIFSVMAHLVAARTREFGVRSALGATRGSLVGLALREQLLPVGAGLAAGTAAGIGLGRLTTSLLYGVAPADPAALALALGVLVAAAAAAALLPAWRGSRLDPVAALREE